MKNAKGVSNGYYLISCLWNANDTDQLFRYDHRNDRIYQMTPKIDGFKFVQTLVFGWLANAESTTVKQAMVLVRVRRQIELLFKR